MKRLINLQQLQLDRKVYERGQKAQKSMLI